MNNYIASLCEMHKLQFISSNVVGGGDINAAYAVDTNKGRFFLKVNDANKYPQMFAKEADGLNALQQASKCKVPAVVATGVHHEKQYLLLQWLQQGSASAKFWIDFANALAQLHCITNKQFGWTSSNYIGSLVQQNEVADTWSAFYTTQRIVPLVKKLNNDHSFTMNDVNAAEKVCRKLNDIFPAEQPSLLHGDLWAGNFMAVASEGSNTVPGVFDPAVYYGHREMDIGMSLLFGGFDHTFYNAYNEAYPLEKSWRKRVSLTQLYPLLVHAILFGGSYISKCRNVLQEWS